MKKFTALCLALIMTLTLCACAGLYVEEPVPTQDPADDGKVFNIYAWNEEFKGFFEQYYTVPQGVAVNWIINPSDNGEYQDVLDEVLAKQDSLPVNQKVDMFLAEADYIVKYVNSDSTQDVRALGVNDLSEMYEYTVQAATDDEGALKGVTFQCCPAAVIYRRSIARAVLGTDDPDEVQIALDTWDKFDVVAAEASRLGYLMTPSYVETYRVFSNNFSAPWVDRNNKLHFDRQLKTWAEQTKKYLDLGYTLPTGVFDAEKDAQMFADGRTLCFFGPAWYYNFCMGNAMDPEKGCYGDWAICEGPQAYFWGGTWLLAASGSDNPSMLADIMNTFTVNEEVCSKLVSEQNQFSNNQSVNQRFAEDPAYGNAFLGGQNDTAVYAEMADEITFKYKTVYDQMLTEQYQEYMLDYCAGVTTLDEALNRFYQYVNDTYPEIITPQL